jgi:hypothetical protein
LLTSFQFLSKTSPGYIYNKPAYRKIGFPDTENCVPYNNLLKKLLLPDQLKKL